VIPSPPERLIGDGLIAAWERQCAAIEGSALYRHDGLVVALVDTGTPTLNTVLVDHEPDDPEAAVQAADALCAAHGASLGVDLPAGVYPRLESALTNCGLRPTVRRLGMAAALPPDARVVGEAAARVGPVLREAVVSDLEALHHLEVSCFGLPAAVARRFLPPVALEDPDFRTVVCLAADGAVIAKAHGHCRGSRVGVTGVATLVPWRGRGLATALVADLLTHASGRGASWAWLVAELGAVDVYYRLGFRPVVEWVVWLRR
jgi:predicted GNAT family acetyltransferase